MDLYREICQVMLWRRQESKQLPSEISGPSKEKILSHLAFEMMIRGERDMKNQETLDVLEPVLQRFTSNVSGEQFLEEVSSNGLLIERENSLYAFAHHTICEYLASQFIRGNSLVETLVEAVDDPWWRETSILYSVDAEADKIVEACIQSGSTTALSLAFDCEQNQGSLEPSLRAKLKNLQDEAFTSEASSEHRQLIANVLIKRHLAEAIEDEEGVSICLKPATMDLYSLYRLERNVPQFEMNDGYLGGSDLAADPWFNEVTDFIVWLNSVITDTEALGHYRLASRREADYFVSTTRSEHGQSGDTLSAYWVSVLNTPDDTDLYGYRTDRYGYRLTSTRADIYKVTADEVASLLARASDIAHVMESDADLFAQSVSLSSRIEGFRLPWKRQPKQKPTYESVKKDIAAVLTDGLGFPSVCEINMNFSEIQATLLEACKSSKVFDEGNAEFQESLDRIYELTSPVLKRQAPPDMLVLVTLMEELASIVPGLMKEGLSSVIADLHDVLGTLVLLHRKSLGLVPLEAILLVRE
jgi:hypothetical protein